MLFPHFKRKFRTALICITALLSCLTMSGCGDGVDSDSKQTAKTDSDTKKPEPLTFIEVSQLNDQASVAFQQRDVRTAIDKLERVRSELKPRIETQTRSAQLYLEATSTLVQVYNRVGLRWEAEPLLFELIQAGNFTVEQLLLFCNRNEILADVEFMNGAILAFPDEKLPLLNLARERMSKNDLKEAREVINEVLADHPNLIEAQAIQGLILAEEGELSEFEDWRNRLAEGAENHPDVWIAEGVFARGIGEKSAALRCFLEALQIDPVSQRANYQAGLLLTDLGKPEDAAGFLEKAEKLNSLNYSLHPMYREGAQIDFVKPAAELTESMGRLWEAWAWYSIMVQLGLDTDRSDQKRAELLKKCKEQDLPRVMKSHRPTLLVDVDSFPKPDWKSIAQSQGSRSRDSGTVVTLSDVAAETGLKMQYFSSPDPDTEGVRMFEITGGGVGVIDFDLDQYPDVYLTQGTRFPVQEENREFTDRIFMNSGGEQWIDVTEILQLGDARFSQGVGVGDFDNDGFPDLYIGNLSGNRLYQNNGDGTFTEVDWSAFGDRGVWTTSCMIADLNGDGLPDVYDANYLGGDDIHERICGAGVQRACAPSVFDGESDQVFINLGDGTFKDVSNSSGVAPLMGKGLGLLAADFDQSGQLSLFVANDAVANNFLKNESSDPFNPEFTDLAMANGLAFDQDGRFQACMGVAFDEVNAADGFELFVTNYYNDSNTLYSQGPGLLFDDLTREAGLRESSFSKLGFGCQFLDIELNGTPDLVITNGHVDDYSHEGQEYRMRPQLYRNQGDARFLEVEGQLSGNFFNQQLRGRGLALLDWNRDGREDFIISHLDSPVALVENQTVNVGHYLSVFPIGTKLSRDAFGVTITIESGDFVRTRQLAAGSGYQAANERMLSFGLGDRDKIDRMTVRWLDGETQTFENLSVDQELILVQGKSPVTVSAETLK